MNVLDIMIVIIYILFMLFLGIKFSKNNETAEDYFLAGRSMPFIPIALSVIATMVSAATFVGAPGGSYTEGLRYFMLNANLPLVIFIAAVIFVPFLYNLKVTSCYEYLSKRFGNKIQILCAVGFLFTSVVFTGTMIYGPSMIIKALTGWDMAIIIPTLMFIAIFYTLLGGIRAVIWSDAIQMVVLWFGIILCFITVLKNIDTPQNEIWHFLSESGKLNSLNSNFDITLENGVWGSIFGIGLLHLQYFTSDQSQVQRMFTSKSMKSLKSSLLLSGIIVNIQFALFLVIGLFLFVKYNGQSFADPNGIMIDFILHDIPHGTLGLILAAILAATMSSIDSLLNSMSVVFINDIIAPLTKESMNLKKSKQITFVFGIIIVIFTYIGLNGKTSALLSMMGEYCSYITGSIFGVFFLGMFTKKANEKGALSGFVLGIIATLMVAKLTPINWSWYNTVGVLSCIIFGYIASLITFDKELDQNIINNYTIPGMRKTMIAKKQIKENGVYILPGSCDTPLIILLVIFILQFIVLYKLQNMY